MSLPTLTQDFLLHASLGLNPDAKTVIKFGRIAGTAATTIEIIAPFVPTFLTAASTLRIRAGGNADDSSAGIGAQAVKIIGVDSNYNEIEEYITTNGTSASAATNKAFLRVFHCHAARVGSNEVNVGDMTLEAVTGLSVQSKVIAGDGQSAQLFYTVPKGYTALVVGKETGVMDIQGSGTTQHLAHFEGFVRAYNESSNNNYESWRKIFDSSHDTDGRAPSASSEWNVPCS